MAEVDVEGQANSKHIQRQGVHSTLHGSDIHPAGSLVASSYAVDSIPRYLADELPHTDRENVSGHATSEKRLLELAQLRSRDGTATASGGRNVDEHSDIHVAETLEEPVASSRRVEHRRNPRHETDGGVRLAGGRLGEVDADELDQDGMSESEGSTLPPPYSSHFE